MVLPIKMQGKSFPQASRVRKVHDERQKYMECTSETRPSGKSNMKIRVNITRIGSRSISSPLDYRLIFWHCVTSKPSDKRTEHSRSSYQHAVTMYSALRTP
ncbi:hypothetical protein TESG_04881 [Trichophyton tonsurans CBS 112818]|nr:hypothetical protein TESG_04881 [Trichophyton tonsurans CBS 112818]